MTIPREFISLLLAKIDIVEVIGTYLPLHKKSNNNYFACCPFHQEKTASFSVSQVKQFYYCFGCGAHGNVIDFCIQRERLSFPEAIETLARRLGMEIPAEGTNQFSNRKKDHELYELLQQISNYYCEQLRQSSVAIQYLKNRGINGITAKQFKLGYAPSGWTSVIELFGRNENEKKRLHDIGLITKKEHSNYYDRFRERIMFPIVNPRGHIIGFGARVIKQEEEPKYLNSPDTALFQKGHELYGLYHVLNAHPQVEQIILVEGYMDVIALFQYGITYAVAALGTAITVAHIQRLFRYTSKLIFCFDGDKAGRLAAWRALLVILPCLHEQAQVQFLFLPEGEDPDTIIRKENKLGFEKRLKETLSLSTFFFQTLSQQNELNSLEGRARFATQALQYIKTLPAGLFQNMMLEELAKRARIDPTKFKQQLEQPFYKPSPAKTNRIIPWSPILQRVMSLLLQYPRLISLIQGIPEGELPGLTIFYELYTLIKSQPHLTTVALLEYWRDKPEQAWLLELARRDYLTPEEGIEDEFVGALKQLTMAVYDECIKSLMAKAANNTILEIEKNQLADWINKKKTLTTE